MAGDVIVYDYCAFTLLMIIVIYYLRRSVQGTHRARIMAMIVIATLWASFADAARVLVSSDVTVSNGEFLAVNIAYYMLLTLVPPLFLMYAIATTDMWHVLKKEKLKVTLISIPVAVYEGTLILNLFTPTLMSVGEGRELIKHNGFYLCYAVIIFYMFVTEYFFRKRIRPVDVRRYRIYVAPINIVAFGLILSIFIQGHHILCFVLSICILMLILFNKKVEDTVDIATGMHTYKVFAEDMRTGFATGRKMTVVLVNITNYKYTIRMVGYDKMLRMMGDVSAEIMGIMRRHHAQFMCYYNGDGKFAVQLPSRHFDRAHEIADEIARSIRQNIKMEVADYELDINTCLLNCPEDINDVDSLFMLISDLDTAESDGSVLSASSITETKEFAMKKEMTSIIDRALANHYFSVFYQPIYDTKKKKFNSAEALLRLRDPKYGYISPALFIPLAEKSGAIHAIGSFVLEEVVKFIATDEFKELGVEYIEINLSAMQCLRSDLADEIITLANRYNVDPSKINLEITETASGYSQSKLYGNISALSQNGFKFSLDDFGTGYSNLMRITSMPLDIVKLDRVFVLMEESGGHHVIIKNLIEMLKNMKFKVLVEGVETKEMMDSFIQMGVDEIQGFYFSRPLTRSAYVRFIREKSAVN